MLLFRGLGLKGEIYADQAALELTADPDAFIQAMTSLRELITAKTPKFEQDAELLSKQLNALKNNANDKHIEPLQNLLNQQILEFKDDPQYPALADRIAMAEKWKVDHTKAPQVNVKNIKEEL
jgi:Zn-dependent protease with chaperone function